MTGQLRTERYSYAEKVVKDFLDGGSMDRLLSKLRECHGDRERMVQVIDGALRERTSRERLPIALAICRHTREDPILNQAAEEALRYL